MAELEFDPKSRYKTTLFPFFSLSSLYITTRKNESTEGFLFTENLLCTRHFARINSILRLFKTFFYTTDSTNKILIVIQMKTMSCKNDGVSCCWNSHENFPGSQFYIRFPLMHYRSVYIAMIPLQGEKSRSFMAFSSKSIGC